VKIKMSSYAPQAAHAILVEQPRDVSGLGTNKVAYVGGQKIRATQRAAG